MTMELNFNQDWNYKEVVKNIEALKSQVWDIIASFSYLEIKELIEFKRELRRLIYSLKMEEWRRDRIFEYIYNDFELEELKRLI